ncbi:nitric oxide synthase-interacting protein-like [Gigantopelta aegis]|uniref:nitric oxide synthase-interacting protein-like n=1 Tax=Gigantopelta aegis TaxID=1735272 RepID=UPI001B88A80F|nr:nitric oxide synthase-interacting protein-like [Gigantopelta aegis]XP_041365840.1 nitric oxide synthase-interacting protein-like [Gigantopelta aegis]XP_041365841.1 nitric oxide synthase-interacting protein-like [Gigantopelta aegis]
MTRHARNCTAGTVYTYHERKKDTTQSGYGSKSVRLGKDSIKEFDCCCLTLQPCKDPVVTPDGYLFDKEAILEYILHQKKSIARKLKEFEKQKNKLHDESLQLKKAEDESKLNAFIKQESKPIENRKCIGEKTEEENSISNMKHGKAKALPSFWIPSLTPDAGPSRISKPDEKVRCPMSGKPLKLKDFTDVKFTPIKDGDNKTALISKTARYVCAITNDVLGNSVPCAILRTSGNVVTMECVDKIIRKDMIDPTNGKKLLEKDIIQLQRGATGFSGTGLKLKATKAGSSLQA